MLITVKAKPGAGKNEIKQISENSYEIKVHASPDKGKANKAIIKLLSEYFDIPKSDISIKSGEFARTKIIEILK